MSSITTWVNCPTLQGRLTDVFCQGGVEPLPLLGFTFSEANNAVGLQQLAIPGGGKKRTVQLTYTPRVLESEVDDTINRDTCTSSNKRGTTSRTFDLDITTGAEIAKTFDYSDLSTICESNQDYMARLIADLMDGVERQMETKLAEKLWAAAGGFPTNDLDQDGTAITSSTKIVSTKLSDGTLDHGAHQGIMQTARFSNYCSAPVVVGDYEIGNYYDSIGVGCCAQTGVDFGQVQGQAPLILKTYRLGEAAAGDYSKFLVMSAGAALPIWYNHFEGANVLNDDSRIRTVVVSRNGIPMDLAVTVGTDSNCDSVHVKLSIAWDLFHAGAELFENSDRLDGVNFIQKFDVVNP